VSRCCISIITRPTPNSTAEKIKKKKDNESMLRLSKASPIIKTNPYRVIQRSSAVNNKCSDVLGLVSKVLKRNKNKITNVLISPMNKINY